MCVSKMMVLALTIWAGGDAMRVRKEASELLEEVAKAHDQEQTQDAMPVLADDFNPIGEGTIVGGHSAMVLIFGGPQGLSIDDLRTISVNRRFPSSFTFGGPLRSRPNPRPPQP